jgi:hypothetical protein
MADFGGEMRLVANGQTFIMRGTFSIDGTGVSIDHVVNQDGSTSRIFKPDGYGCEIKSLEAGKQNWNAIMRQPRGTFSIIEAQTGVIHVFGNAFFKGSPKEDRDTGEVTGLEIRSDSYRRVDS